MTDPQIVHIPLDATDEGALPRDRTVLEPEALAELQASILMSGLRQPIEVYKTEAEGALRYGLISDFRRLTVCRALWSGGAGESRDHGWSAPFYLDGSGSLF